MTNEEKIITLLEEQKRSQEAFVAEWRANVSDAKAVTARLKEDAEKRRIESPKEQARLEGKILLLAAVIFALCAIAYFGFGRH